MADKGDPSGQNGIIHHARRAYQSHALKALDLSRLGHVVLCYLHASVTVQVNLTGDMIISAGVVAYLGAFTASFRQQLVDGFLQLCSKAVSSPHSLTEPMPVDLCAQC